MRRRLAFLVLIAGIVLFARFGFRRPVDVDLQLRYGAASAQVREVTLVISDAGEHVARDLHLSYPKGAPAEERHRVRLKSGSYQVGVRMLVEGAPERHLTRPLAVDGEGTYPLELSE
jgi:hypothetical protein